MSLATDRNEIIDAVYLGQAELPATIPINKYDPVEASRLLDEIGLDKKDGEGCRLGPDGKRFTVPVAFATGRYAEWVAIGEMVTKFWREVGLCTSQKTMAYDLYQRTGTANELYVGMGYWHSFSRWPWGEVQEYIGGPTHPWNGLYEWYKYYDTGGKQGVAPPAAYIELRKLFSEMYSTGDFARQKEIWEKMKQILTDEIWWIPIVEYLRMPLIVSEKLGNVAAQGDGILIRASVPIWYFK